MSFTNTISVSVREGATTLTDTRNIPSEAITKIVEVIPDSSTDLEIALAMDVSQLKAFGMISTQDVTVETNSGGSPTDTFNLLAGEMVFFRDGDVAIFSGDVTSIFVTNASGSAATLTITAGYDPTV